MSDLKTNGLYQKLFEAKKEIGKISKDSTNPFYKSKYFDINKLLEHVEPILQKHNLLLLQPINENSVKTVIVDIDDSAMVESCMDLTDIKDPQKRGSEITYYRRYTLQSLLGLQAEDDDANYASNSKPNTNINTNASKPKNTIEKWLNPNTTEWDLSIDYCRTKGKTLDDILSMKKGYGISKKNRELFINELTKQVA